MKLSKSCGFTEAPELQSLVTSRFKRCNPVIRIKRIYGHRYNQIKVLPSTHNRLITPYIRLWVARYRYCAKLLERRISVILKFRPFASSISFVILLIRQVRFMGPAGVLWCSPRNTT